jgi:hypothetical protein
VYLVGFGRMDGLNNDNKRTIEHAECSMVILLLVVLWTDRKAVWALDKLKMRLIWRAVDLDCSSNLDSFETYPDPDGC